MELTEEMKARVEQGKAWMQKTKDEPVPDLLSRLQKYEQDLLQETNGLSKKQFEWKPAPDQWSVKEVCLHISHSVRTVAGLIPVLADGETLPGTVNAKLGQMDADPGSRKLVRHGLHEAFHMAEEATRSVEGQPNLETTFPHPFFGDLNCREWIVFNLMHLSVHLRQIRRVKDSEEFPG